MKAPKTLTVFYADTRQELPPLAIAALQIMDELRDRGIHVEVVCAPLDKRFMVYILGRGVPPPNNNTLRWCTRQIKIDPMQAALEQRLAALDGNVLMITGVRQGESAIRDKRIEMSCGKDGAECGQGWYQKVLPEAKGLKGRLATLAPLLHWRVCHVWEWLKHWAPLAEFGDWSTAMIADAYGGDEAEEINARTGCTGCPLASEEKALETVLAMPHWAYLAPLRGLKELWRELREPQHRLRKAGIERLKDGSIAANPPAHGTDPAGVPLDGTGARTGHPGRVQRRSRPPRSPSHQPDQRRGRGPHPRADRRRHLAGWLGRRRADRYHPSRQSLRRRRGTAAAVRLKGATA
ncbi:phosphoadenosine phosphosulfate reductase family protein [Pseudomonas aeruginosa]|nr:phosphoadenosine phosphosulfate reductase family protein [Pseudomonas aeruginosa]